MIFSSSAWSFVKAVSGTVVADGAEGSVSCGCSVVWVWVGVQPLGDLLVQALVCEIFAAFQFPSVLDQ